MQAHHKRVIERLTEAFKDDPRFPALIVGGSLAKGREREDSDVDILLVASDEEFARRQKDGDFWYLNRDICDYAGGYVEGKVINEQFLIDAADHGSEPARAAFMGAFLAYARIPELEGLLKSIPVYQEQERQGKIEAFYSQVLLLNWFVPEAEKRNDAYLLSYAASNLVLFGGRLILAYNRILFPSYKWFMYEVKRAEKKPANFMELADDLLKHPCKEHAQVFCDCISNFQDWGVMYTQAVSRFVKENEWNWLEGRPPLQDW